MSSTAGSRPDREAALAAALRANLRRRKLAPSETPAPAAPPAPRGPDDTP